MSSTSTVSTAAPNASDTLLSLFPLTFRYLATYGMASPLSALTNASAVFTVPASGTTTDARTGNILPNTTTITVTLYLRQNPIPSSADLPGIDVDTEDFEGYAVNPMALDSRIEPGTIGTLTFSGQPAARCEVVAARYPYGTTGIIGATLQSARGDTIRLQRFNLG